jgi:hypothetical protein
MAKRRPEAVTTMAVVNIIFGSLSILCGACGAAGLVFLTQMAKVQGPPGGGPNPVAQLMERLNKECPGYQFVEGGRSVGVLVLGIVLIAAAIGLLQMQSWARWTTVAYAALAIPLHVGYLGYELAVVMPATQRIQSTLQMGGGFGAPQNPGQQAGQQAGTAFGVVAAAGISILHAGANLVVMLLPAVGAAFAGRRPRRRRDYDEDDSGEEADEDEDDRPRRPRRRSRDEEDEGFRSSRRE